MSYRQEIVVGYFLLARPVKDVKMFEMLGLSLNAYCESFAKSQNRFADCFPKQNFL